MKKLNSFLLLSSGLLLCLVITTPFVLAQDTPQWFPEEGTQIDYSVTNIINLLNGTESTEVKFDIFGDLNVLTLRPVHLRHLTGIAEHSSEESLVNNTTVILRTSYTNENSTHLLRTIKVVWETGESNESLFIIKLETAEGPISWNHLNLYSKDEYVQRNYFQEETLTIVDYINNDFTIGENCGITNNHHNYLAIVAVTSDSLIAYCTDGATSTYNLTYVFDLDGRTKTVTIATRYISYSGFGVDTGTYRFDVIESNGEPGFFENLPWIWILGGVAGVELIVIVIVSVVKKRK